MHGATTLTVTPCVPIRARAREGGGPGLRGDRRIGLNPTTPKFDPMLMIFPPPCGIMARARRLTREEDALQRGRHRPIVVLSVTSSAAVVPVHPALLTDIRGRTPGLVNHGAPDRREPSVSQCARLASRMISACTSLIPRAVRWDASRARGARRRSRGRQREPVRCPAMLR